MIFVTVGTHHQPFERLLRALEDLPTEELWVQYGPGRPPRGVAGAADYLPFDAMIDRFRRADKVITHAGVGSIICARREGHLPLVVPRRHDLGEHVDDHQAELSRELGAHGTVIPVWDTSQLAETLDEAPSRGTATARGEAPLCPSVRAALLGDEVS